MTTNYREADVGSQLDALREENDSLRERIATLSRSKYQGIKLQDSQILF